MRTASAQQGHGGMLPCRSSSVASEEAIKNVLRLQHETEEVAKSFPRLLQEVEVAAKNFPRLPQEAGLRRV
ncbi:unnamed protein product [Macrosiphum euphorbiae]|uniref:Uncharacterized protein n=1 Tax=Macrosiphum euphorbiae TaxID=13131 RepID=A0AAV0X2D2_9HEMI|nr:unnamed protein product [Macrosiphum euphorbiae]